MLMNKEYVVDSNHDVFQALPDEIQHVRQELIKQACLKIGILVNKPAIDINTIVMNYLVHCEDKIKNTSSSVVDMKQTNFV